MNDSPATAKPQFSVSALLLTVAAVAVVLTLTFRATSAWGCVALVTLMLVFSAFITVAFIYGKESARPFCIGAAFPLGLAYIHTACDLGWSYDEIGSVLGRVSLMTMRSPGMTEDTNIFLGTSILIAIALGYLCVWFRWLIERKGPPESRP